jgi:hypothetical protein
MLALYPKNQEITAYLDVIDNNKVKVAAVKEMERQIKAGQGTVGDFVDWKAPDEWINKRLTGIGREMGSLFWKASGKVINPRYTEPIRWVVEKKELVIVNAGDFYEITERGKDFLSNHEGKTVREIDLEEGFAYLLSILSENPGLKAPGIMPFWNDFVRKVAPTWQAKSSIRDLYMRRISNLRERGMSIMEKFHWFITEKGKSYLNKFDTDKFLPLRSVVTPKTKKVARAPKAREASDHDLAQLRLVELGYLMGFAVYVAKSDKSKKVKGVELAEYEIGELPARGLSRELKRRMANIDIIWFDADTFLPVAFIEIETTTGFNKNLTKINDLLSEIPPGYAHSAGVYIIGYRKDREQAEDIMFGPTFAPLEGRCREYKFISVEEVAIEYEGFEPRLKREFDKIEKAKEEIQKRKEYIEKLKERKFSLFALS